jgi:hypothetical protein
MGRDKVERRARASVDQVPFFLGNLCRESSSGLWRRIMKYPEVKSVLVGKWFMSLNREGTILWWGQVLDEVNPGTYLVLNNRGGKGVVLLQKMTGWRFYETREELSKAMDEIEARSRKCEGGVR